MNIVLDVTAALAVVASFVVLARAWPELPQRVPVHFGITGFPDAWGPKAAAIVWPLIILLIFSALEAGSLTIAHAKLTHTGGIDVAHFLLLLGLLKIEAVGFILYAQYQAFEVSVGRAERIHPSAIAIFVVVLLTTVFLSLRLR